MAVATKTLPSLDTNILLRIILQDNASMLDKIMQLLAKHDELAIADQAIIEMVYVLGGHYGYTRQELAAAVQALMQNQHINLNRSLFERVLPHYVQCPAVSFTDACLEAYAFLNKQTPLYTFDKKLARQLPDAELLE